MNMILDFLFPCRCVVCGRGETDLCERCLGAMKGGLRVKEMGGIEKLTVLYDYKDKKVKKAVEAIKFGFNQRLIKALLTEVGDLPWSGVGVIVPVPLHKYRHNWRGFNQAEVMAQTLGNRWRLPVENLLARTRNTAQQAKIEDKRKRRENVRGAFRVNDKFLTSNDQIKGRKMLLVDDVCTSGETMKECAKALKGAGVKKVYGLVLAG